MARLPLKKGPEAKNDLASALKLTKHQLCRSLENLEDKGRVNATLERPARFSAVSLERVLDQFYESREGTGEGFAGKQVRASLQLAFHE